MSISWVLNPALVRIQYYSIGVLVYCEWNPKIVKENISENKTAGNSPHPHRWNTAPTAQRRDTAVQHQLYAEPLIHDIGCYVKDCSGMKYVYLGTVLPLFFWDESSIIRWVGAFGVQIALQTHLLEDCWHVVKETGKKLSFAIIGFSFYAI